MFTGIVQGTGTIISIDKKSTSSTFSIDLGHLSSHLSLGSSVSIDGVCMTVTSQKDTIVFFDAIQETLSRTTLGQSVDGIEALEKMMNMNKQTISNAQNFTQPERPLTIEDVRSMMKDKRYFDPKERDESYVRKVDDAFARLYRG